MEPRLSSTKGSDVPRNVFRRKGGVEKKTVELLIATFLSNLD